MTVTTDLCARCGHGKRFHKVGTGLGSCGTLTRLGDCSCLGYEELVTVVADDTPQERSTFEVSCELLEWVEGLEKGLITPAGQREIAAIIKPRPLPLLEQVALGIAGVTGHQHDEFHPIAGEAAHAALSIVADWLDREGHTPVAAAVRRGLVTVQ